MEISKKLWWSLVIAFIAGIFLGQYFLKRNIWTGFYYPDLEKIDDERTWIISPPLYSLKECREWVNKVRKDGDNFDYSCGQGCRFTTRYGGTHICRTDEQ